MDKHSFKLYYQSITSNMKMYQCAGNLRELAVIGNHTMYNVLPHEIVFVPMYPIMKATSENSINVRETNLSSAYNPPAAVLDQFLKGEIDSGVPTLFTATYDVTGSFIEPGMGPHCHTLSLSKALSAHYNVFNDLIDISAIVQRLFRIGHDDHICSGYLDPKTRKVFILIPRYRGNYLQGIIPVNLMVLMYITFQKIIANTSEENAKLMYAAPTSKYLNEMDNVKNRLQQLGRNHACNGSSDLFQTDFVTMYLDFSNTIWKTVENNEAWNLEVFGSLIGNIKNKVKNDAITTLRSIEQQYNDMYRKLADLVAQKTVIERRLCSPDSGSERILEFMKALLRAQTDTFKVINYEVVSENIHIDLNIKERINFDPAFLTMPVVKNNPHTKIFFTKLYEEQIDAYFKQTIRINIDNNSVLTVENVGNNSDDYYHKKGELATFPNTHHTHFSCFGSYKHEFTRAFDSDNFTVLFAYFKESVANINIADGAVYPAFTRGVLGTEYLKVYSNLKNDYITLQDLYLKKDEEPEPEPVPAPAPQQVAEDPLDIEDQPDVEDVFETDPNLGILPIPIEPNGTTITIGRPRFEIPPIPMDALAFQPTMTTVNNMPVQAPTFTELREIVQEMRDRLTVAEPYGIILPHGIAPVDFEFDIAPAMTAAIEDPVVEEIRQAEELGVL